MKKRLVLVSLDWVRPKDNSVSLGHASLMAHLSPLENVVSQRYSVICPTYKCQNVIDNILALDDGKTDVGIGGFVWNEVDVQFITKKLKSAGFSGRVILGGPQVSYCEAGRLENDYPFVNFFIRGYGEEALLKLMTLPNNSVILKIIIINL